MPYPISAELRIVPGAASSRFSYDPSVHHLSNPACTVDLEQQARTAYRRVLERRFDRSSAAGPALVMEVSVVGADVAGVDGRGYAVVEHASVLRDATGAEIARWSLRAEGDVVGLEGESIVKAFARAADRAADDLDARFEQQPGAVAWLREHGVEPSVRSAVTQRARVPRTGTIPYVDAGLGVGWTSARAEFSASLRAGVSGAKRSDGASGARIAPGLMVDVAFERRATSYASSPRVGVAAGAAHATITSLGADLGLVGRIDVVELRAGVGAHYLMAEATIPYSLVNSGSASAARFETTIGAQRGVGSIFAGLRVATEHFSGRIRWSYGAEVRRFFDATLQFGPDRVAMAPVVVLYVGGEMAGR